MPYANNKGADQTEHLRSLISTFIVCCLDTVMSVKIDLEGSGCGLSQVGVLELLFLQELMQFAKNLILFM